MLLGRLFGKWTWMAVAAAAGLLMAGIALGAVLINREVLPPTLMAPWLYGCCAISPLLGGCIAGKGRGEPMLPLAVALLLYALLWIAALASSEPLAFDAYGLWITACVAGGGTVGCLLCRKKKRKRAKYSGKISSKRRRHLAT